MAVAMEPVAWRGSGASNKSSSPKSNTWGADAQKLMQMMMGQLQQSPSEPPQAQQLSTLDLFHQADHPLELSEPELPLPSGWEKCLDLQSGKLYYVQRSSGVSTFDDPRKLHSEPHEFLGSKRSEEEANCRSSSSVSETTPKWTFDREEEEQHDVLELDLNLATSTSSRSRSVVNQQTVCTVEMIQNALRRTSGKNAAITKSSSLSSLTSVDHAVDATPSTPSTSSSSSTSSKSRSTRPSSSSKVCEDGSNALVMGACTRCLMYVMLKKMDPRCPRCESEVPVDFSTGPPSCKRQRR